jgi:predicted DNA repair protein MutK
MSKYPLLFQGTCCVCNESFEKILRYSCGSKPPKLCGKSECKNKLSSITMARTNTIHASARMKANNPMANKRSLRKMRRTLMEMGHKPKVRGGNGSGPSPAEMSVAQALGWEMQVVVPTRMPRVSGYPTHYKLDVGNPDLKVGIEVDGNSHQMLSRKLEDAKKEKFLRGLGWIVLRVSNRQALEELPSTISRLKALIPTSPTGP